MIHQFGAQHAAEVVFVGKFAKHGAGGAPGGVLKIHAIAQVHHHCKGIHRHKKPFANGVIERALFNVKRQQHHHYPQRMGVHDGGGVEHKAAFEHFTQVG